MLDNQINRYMSLQTNQANYSKSDLSGRFYDKWEARLGGSYDEREAGLAGSYDGWEVMYRFIYFLSGSQCPRF